MRRSPWRLAFVWLLTTAPPAGAATLYVASPDAFEATAGGLRYVPGANQTVPVTLGTNAFTSFGDAVMAANTNDDPQNAIRVAAGSFDVSAPQVRVSKNLTVIGAGSGATIVRATANTPAQTGDGRAFLLVDRGVSVHLSQFAIEGMAPASIAAAPPVRVSEGIRFTETGTALPVSSLLDRLAFQSIRGGNPSANDFDGVAVNVLAGDVTVAVSVFVNIGRVGANYSDADAAGPATASGSLLGNTYFGKGAGNTLDFGTQITGGAIVTVAGNTFRDALGEASIDGTNSAGVLVFQDTSSGEAPPTATIRYNTFDTNRQGITVGIQSDDASSVTITENNIVHNAGTFGIFSPRTATFPATDNFWGSPGGPFNAVNNPTGDPTNQVSSPVTPLTPFAPAPFAMDFPPAPFAIPFALPPASIDTVVATIGGTVRRAGTGPPESGVAVILDDNGNGSLDQGEVETTTDGEGGYRFTNLVAANGGTAYEVVLVLPSSSTALPARQMAILSGGAPSATLDFTVEEGTAPPTTAPPTLPACDPRDCDGNVCTVGDTCAGRVCQPGPLLTAGQLSRFVRDGTNRARDACGGNRRSAVEKIARPLTQAFHLLVQAGNAVRETKLRKKLSRTRRAVLRAEKQLAKRRATLSPACVASLDPTIARARTWLSCLP